MARAKANTTLPQTRRKKRVRQTVALQDKIQSHDFSSITNTRGSRPRTYNPKYAERVCRLIMEGKTLKEACERQGTPAYKQVIQWLGQPSMGDFRDMYYHARRVQAEILVDDMLAISDNAQNDTLANGNSNNAAVQRARLQIDTRKWLAAKMVPRLYGEKIEHEHGVTGDLADLIKAASNRTDGLPPPIEAEILDGK